MKGQAPPWSEVIIGIVVAACVALTAGGARAFAAPPAQGPREVDVVAFVDRINRWHLSHFAGYKFNRWISLGDIVRFNERVAQGDVQIYIDPARAQLQRHRYRRRTAQGRPADFVARDHARHL